MSEKKAFNRFMGWVAVSASAVPALIAGGVHAGYKLATEDKAAASKAFSDTSDKIVDGAQEIGEEYGPQMLMGILTIVAGGQINESLKKKN